MATSKKTTGNLVWALLLCSVIVALPKFFFTQTENLTVELTTLKNHNCDMAEFFGGVTDANGQPNYIRFAQQKYLASAANPSEFVSRGVLKKPFEVLRLDPCTRSNEVVEITGLTLSTNDVTRNFTPSQLEFICTNCELVRSDADTIIVTVHGADSQLVVKNIDQTLFTKTSDVLVFYQKLRAVAYIVFAVCFGWLLLLLMKKSRLLLVALGVCNLLALASFSLLYKKRFSLGFNLPFGDDIFQSGIALMHHAKYSRYTDLVLYAVPLAVSLFVMTGLLWKKQGKK